MDAKLVNEAPRSHQQGTTQMPIQPPRKVEIQKKKLRRKADRPPQSRNLGNTGAARTRAKKAAGIARGRKAAATPA